MINIPQLECIPNFSEGRDKSIIYQIVDSIQSVNGVIVLNVDIGYAANRTVVTFVGPPDRVIEAAFQGMKTARELINMEKHQGIHPRIGATDVCPFVPVKGITIKEAIPLVEKLAQRVGRELTIPIYLYEHSATTPYRRNLANIRLGEYEGLKEKMNQRLWKPDFGPSLFNSLSGATAMGVRNFLIAYNVNLKTESTFQAKNIAKLIRTSGSIETLPTGQKIRVPGKYKYLKAIGWFVEEYGFAQVSMNLTNFRETGLHHAYLACKDIAEQLGTNITGSELIGLCPLDAILDTGRHFLGEVLNGKQVIAEQEIVAAAIQHLGLNQIQAFEPHEKILEYKIKNYGMDTLH